VFFSLKQRDGGDGGCFLGGWEYLVGWMLGFEGEWAGDRGFVWWL